MNDTVFNVETISDLHEMLDYKKPEHPLITLVDAGKLGSLKKFTNIRIRQGFYSIALKSGAGCDLIYGRRSYDFKEGSLIFMAPGQISRIESVSQEETMTGWVLCFHPDFLRGTNLGKNMDSYTYFSYSANEALHISRKEKDTITSTVETIESEFSMNQDMYSHKLIIANLEVLLHYCKRFYGRQFLTRTTVQKDVVDRFEEILKDRFSARTLEGRGIPHVKELASEMGYSPHYLSDLLKKETGRSTQEHIHDFIIEKAKDQLLGTDETVSGIAYYLGYEYPEHFSAFFKKKVGISPAKYRKSVEV